MPRDYEFTPIGGTHLPCGPAGITSSTRTGSWQPRVYLGVDADTGKERRAAKTVQGCRRHATERLHEFVD